MYWNDMIAWRDGLMRDLNRGRFDGAECKEFIDEADRLGMSCIAGTMKGRLFEYCQHPEITTTYREADGIIRVCKICGAMLDENGEVVRKGSEGIP